MTKRKHAAPAPSVFSRPGTYLAAATAVSGLLLGASGAPVAAVAAAGVALVTLAVIPAPVAPSRRRVKCGHITAGVYIRMIGLLTLVLFGLPKPARRPSRMRMPETGGRGIAA